MNRVAIIGAGPSGLYCAKTMLEGGVEHIDVFERLEMPFGLLRFGVAPDHTTFQRIEDLLGEVLADERVTFKPNTTLGVDITREQLRADYDAVVYATGAPVDWTLEVPGDDLPGSEPAGNFTRWYNGHPDRKEFTLKGVKEAVVVGFGNVAMDAGRILAAPAGFLKGTKAAEDAVADLDASEVSQVTIMARRGPQHAAATTPELKEFGKLDGVYVEVKGTTAEELEQLMEAAEEKRVKSNLKVLHGYITAERPADVRCTVTFQFWARPVRIEGVAHVEKVVAEKTHLVDGRVKGTGEEFELPCQYIVAALGQYGAPIEGMPHEKGIIPNDGGHLVVDGEQAKGEFVTGWARRGATGIIGAAKNDATEVGHLVCQYLGLEEKPEA